MSEDDKPTWRQRVEWLLEHIDAILDPSVVYGWRITSSLAAERFAALQKVAKESHAALAEKDDDRAQAGLGCVCGECDKPFRLTADRWADGAYACVEVSSCESGGIYDMVVRCPHCGHRHDMM